MPRELAVPTLCRVASCAPQVLTRGGEPYLRSAVERTVEAGGRADEEEGASVMLGRGDDDVQWPEPDEAERLLEHDELWQLDATQRAQLCLLLVHQKHEARLLR